MKIIMLGAPGAGKGTQSERIGQKYGLPQISTGDIFRANLSAGTELGLKAKTFMDAGELVPDELTCDLVVDRISKEDCANGYILDGFPRTLAQADLLTKVLAQSGDKVDFAVNVDVPDESIIARMSGRRVCGKCGKPYHIVNMPPKTEGVCDNCGGELIQRKDDQAETVKNRLIVYHEQTQPLIDYYEQQGCLVTVDGTKDIDVVFEDIIAALEA